jgi:hypothetical protein
MGGPITIGAITFNRDFWLVKTDWTGIMQWNKSYGCWALRDSCAKLVVTSDNGFTLVGTTESYGAGGYDLWLIRTDAESGLAWTDSTADTVTLYRGATDPYWNYVRVRIWKIKEIP